MWASLGHTIDSGIRRIGDWGLGREYVEIKKKISHVVLKRHKHARGVDNLYNFIWYHITIVVFVCFFRVKSVAFLRMDCEGESSKSLIDEQEAMEAVVNYLSEEINEIVELEECVTQGVNECLLTKSFPCGLCSKICKSKGGLTNHTRAKHGEKTPIIKSVSPITSDVVCEIVCKAAQSVIKSKLYGEKMTKLISEADLKPSDLLVSSLLTLYGGYCEKLDRDKLLKNFYKLIPESAKMFETKSKEMNVPAYNLIMIHIPDLVVGFYKRGNVQEKLPVIKPIEQSEFGPLSYVAGYIIAKMYRKSKATAGKETPEQLELQSLLSSMKSLDDNEYIDSLSRGKLWNPCENLICIAAECEKVFRQYSAGLVREIPLEQVRADVLQKPKVKSAWDAILSDASLAKSKTSVPDVCLENIIMLYIRVRSFSYTKDVVTQIKLKEKINLHKKALRKALKEQSEAKAKSL